MAKLIKQGYAMKKVWITALGHDQALVAKILGTVRQYGLDGNGHFWTDDLKNMAWMVPKEQLTDSENGLWVLLGTKDDLKETSVRFGLSLLAITVLASRGNGFPILFVDTGEGTGRTICRHP